MNLAMGASQGIRPMSPKRRSVRPARLLAECRSARRTEAIAPLAAPQTARHFEMPLRARNGSTAPIAASVVTQLAAIHLPLAAIIACAPIRSARTLVRAGAHSVRRPQIAEQIRQ